MSGKKNPFISIDAVPVGFLCLVAFGLAMKRSIEVLSEHGMGFRRHSASFQFELPKNLMDETDSKPTEEGKERIYE